MFSRIIFVAILVAFGFQAPAQSDTQVDLAGIDFNIEMEAINPAKSSDRFNFKIEGVIRHSKGLSVCWDYNNNPPSMSKDAILEIGGDNFFAQTWSDGTYESYNNEFFLTCNSGSKDTLQLFVSNSGDSYAYGRAGYEIHPVVWKRLFRNQGLRYVSSETNHFLLLGNDELPSTHERIRWIGEAKKGKKTYIIRQIRYSLAPRKI